MPNERIKKSFFLELRNLCNKYQVSMYAGQTEYQHKEGIEVVQVINFQFYNGQTYITCDSVVEPSYNNKFRNISNYRDLIVVDPIINVTIESDVKHFSFKMENLK